VFHCVHGSFDGHVPTRRSKGQQWANWPVKHSPRIYSSAASAGAVCQKLVDWIVCDGCRDGCQKLGVLRGKYGDGKVRKLV
jgi:hypothetical protein